MARTGVLRWRLFAAIGAAAVVFVFTACNAETGDPEAQLSTPAVTAPGSAPKRGSTSMTDIEPFCARWALARQQADVLRSTTASSGNREKPLGGHLDEFLKLSVQVSDLAEVAPTEIQPDIAVLV